MKNDFVTKPIKFAELIFGLKVSYIVKLPKYPYYLTDKPKSDTNMRHPLETQQKALYIFQQERYITYKVLILKN